MKDNNLDIINTNTKEIIISFHYRTNKERTEIVYVNETSIENTMPINQVMEISSKSSLRSKSKKPKEKILLDEIPLFEESNPIATTKNISEKKIIREHIQATLDFIGENYSSNENKLNALLELTQFVTSVNSLKKQKNLRTFFEALKEARRKRNIPEMKRTLLVISNKI